MNDLSTQVKVIGAIAALSLVCLVGVLIYAVSQGQSYNDKLCESQNDSRRVLRDVLRLSEAQGARNRYPARIVRNGVSERVVIVFPALSSADEFYDVALNLVRPVPC